MANFIKKLFKQTDANQSPANDINNQPIPIGRLEDLESKLNNANPGTPETKIETPQQASKNFNIPHDWVDDDIQIARPLKVSQPMSLLNKILFSVVGILIIVLAAAMFIWTREINVIDPEKVITRATAPVSVDASELLKMPISIENLNKTPLANAILITRYGKGAYSSNGKTIERTELGFIDSGAIKKLEIPFILNGQPGEEREISFELQYSISNLASRYALDFSKTLRIERSPLSLRLELEPQQTIGEAMPFTLNLSTIKTLDYENLVIEIDQSPRLRLDFDNARGIEEIGATTKIKLDELLPSEPFKVSGLATSTAESPGPATIEARLISDELILASVIDETQLVLPPVMITRQGSSSGVVGQELNLRYQFKNTTNTTIQNVTAIGDLSGQFSDVHISRGRFNSVASEFSVDPLTLPILGSLRPGESFSVEASLVPTGGSLIKVDWLVNGVIPSVGPSQRQVGKQSFDYELDASLKVDAYALYRQGNQVNRGPLPPVVGSETTYTIVLGTRVANPAIRPGSLRATLPSNVSVIGRLPSGIIQNGQTLIWSNPSRNTTLNFQVAITPTPEQVGQRTFLMQDIVFSYQDNNLNTVTESISPITTDLDRDSGFSDNEGVVQSAN